VTIAPLSPAFRAMVRDRLRARAEGAGLDGLLLLVPGNVACASGWLFWVIEHHMGLWLPTAGDATLFAPHLELENALAVQGVRVETYEEFPGHMPPALSTPCGARSARTAFSDFVAPSGHCQGDGCPFRKMACDTVHERGRRAAADRLRQRATRVKGAA
jgi:hypothetical protein